MEFSADLFNRFRLFLYGFHPEMRKHIKIPHPTIDAMKVNICVKKYIFQKISEEIREENLRVDQPTLRVIRVRVLQEYLSMKSTPSPLMKADGACVNIMRYILVGMLKNTELKPVADPLFSTMKQKYKDPKLQPYLESKEMKKLAEKVDKAMEEPQTIRSFSRLVALDWKKELQEIISNVKGVEWGADDYNEASLALILLQKNEVFKGYLDALEDFFAPPLARYRFIEAACKNYEGGITAILSE